MIFTIEYQAKLAFVEQDDHLPWIECDHRNNEVHISDGPAGCGIFEMHHGAVDTLDINETGKAMIFGGVVDELNVSGECLIGFNRPGCIGMIHAHDRSRICINRYSLKLLLEGTEINLDPGATIMFEGTFNKIQKGDNYVEFLHKLLEREPK